MKKGVPDLFIPVSNKEFHGLFIEMKRKTSGSASKDQREWIEYLREAGYKAEVCNGHRQAVMVVNEYLKKL